MATWEHQFITMILVRGCLKPYRTMSLAEMTETSGNHINTLKVHQETRKVEAGVID